jgi:succinate dehydrogenase / fumarate reductase cytochrome b subunit
MFCLSEMSMFHFFRSSLGKKYVMAITGCLLFGFVIAHMIGNLQIFIGPEQINAYGNFLKSEPILLWAARLALLTAAILHVVTAIQVTQENRAARPIPYGEYNPTVASYASRTMIVSGLIVAIFIIYHLLHFTVAIPSVNFLKANADLPNANFLELHDPAGHHDIYHMMLLGFSNIWVSGFYILGMALLCQHLRHGVSSMFQSLGWKSKTYSACIDRFAFFISLIIFIGNSSMPLAVILDRKLGVIHIFQ